MKFEVGVRVRVRARARVGVRVRVRARGRVAPDLLEDEVGGEQHAREEAHGREAHLG